MQRFFLFLLLLLTSSAWSLQLIIEPDMERAPIINAINSAHHSLQLVMYGFTDETILNALIKQKLSGKTVQVILEQSPYKNEDENKKAIAQLKAAHIPWLGAIPALRLIHQKTLIIDDKKALVLTFNFTHSTFKNERNFGLVLDDPKEVHEIESIFSADWNHVEPALSANTNTLLLSPINSRDKLLSLIQQATHSIHIYTQSLSDFKIVGALAKAAKKGVQIEIVTSATLHPKQQDYLTRAGVHIYQSKSLYIHAKVFIIDNQLAVIGSINMTRPSFEKNRELAVVTRDKNVIQQLNATFVQDTHGMGKIKSPMATFMPSKREWLHALKLVKRYMKNL